MIFLDEQEPRWTDRYKRGWLAAGSLLVFTLSSLVMLALLIDFSLR